MSVLLSALYLGLFSWLIYRLRFFNLENIPRWQTIGFFLIKVTAGFALAWIYTSWYTDRSTADTFKYFDDSRVVFELFEKDKKLFFQFLLGTAEYSDQYLDYSNRLQTWWNKYTLYNDARTMVRINTALHFITGGHYAVHTVIFCFLSFTGLTALCKSLLPAVSNKKLFVMLMYLFPSLAFWSSGVMKDGIIFIGTGFTMLSLMKYSRQEISPIKHFAGMAIWMGITFFSKLHIFLVMIPCLAAMYPAMMHKARAGIYFAVCSLVYLVLILGIREAYQPADLIKFMAEKQQENIRVALELKAGSYFELPVLDGTVLNFLMSQPVGLYNAIARPMITEVHSPLVMVSAIENTLLLLAVVAAFLRLVKNRSGNFTPLFWFSVLFVVILYSVVGMMTPVAGSLVRYKIQGLPFLFYILDSMAGKLTVRKRQLENMSRETKI